MFLLRWMCLMKRRLQAPAARLFEILSAQYDADVIHGVGMAMANTEPNLPDRRRVEDLLRARPPIGTTVAQIGRHRAAWSVGSSPAEPVEPQFRRRRAR